MDFVNKFVAFVKGIIEFIKGIVAYFRAINDGKDAEFPSFGF